MAQNEEPPNSKWMFINFILSKIWYRQSNSLVIEAMAPCVDSLPSLPTQNAGKTCFSIPTWIRSPGAGPKPPKNGCWPLAPETAKTNRCDAPRASWWSGVPGMVGPMASTQRQVEY